MMDHDLQNVSDAAYKRLIAEAYPSPKRDIHAAVMAQVTAEAAQSGKKAKILTPAFRSRFVKFGSMAACFVLLVTLGFRVLPMMTKDAAMAESAADMAPMQETAMVTANTAAYDDAEAVPKTAAGGDNGARIQNKSAALTEETEEELAEEPAAAFAYSAVLTDSAAEEEIPEEEPAAEEAAPAAPAPAAEEAPMLMTAPVPATEEAAEDAADSLAIGEAFTEECVVEEAVEEECIAEEPAAEECIAEEAAPQSGISSFESELKLALIREIDTQAYTAWLTGQGYISADDWTVAEFVHDHAVPRERFTELYDALTAFFAQTAPEAEIITYDLSELYPD